MDMTAFCVPTFTDQLEIMQYERKRARPSTGERVLINLIKAPVSTFAVTLLVYEPDTNTWCSILTVPTRGQNPAFLAWCTRPAYF
jgi:hypothetical protein